MFYVELVTLFDLIHTRQVTGYLRTIRTNVQHSINIKFGYASRIHSTAIEYPNNFLNHEV